MEFVGIAGLIGALIGALSGNFGAALLGAAAGAGISGALIMYHENKLQRKSRALSLIQEYTSPDYIQLRNEAGGALRNALKGKQNISWDELHSSLPQEEWQKISKIEHFYRKLDFLVSINEVSRKYLSAYFNCEFWHWQNKYFSPINSASHGKEIAFEHLARLMPPPQVSTSDDNEVARSVTS